MRVAEVTVRQAELAVEARLVALVVVAAAAVEMAMEAGIRQREHSCATCEQRL